MQYLKNTYTMILSKNILPSTIDGIEKLYYHIDGEASFDSNHICLKKNTVLSFDTFFNIFPLAQYKEYTIVQDIIVRGSIEGAVTTEIVGVKDGLNNVIYSSDEKNIKYSIHYFYYN